MKGMYYAYSVLNGFFRVYTPSNHTGSVKLNSAYSVYKRDFSFTAPLGPRAPQTFCVPITLFL